MRLLAVCLLLTATASVRADETTDFLAADNWEGIKEYWKVEGKSVTAKAEKDPGFNTFLVSKKKYKDFELSFSARLVGGKGNSGIQIRSTVVDPKKFVVAGPQADIGKGYWGSLYGERFDAKGKIGGGHMMMASDPKKIGEKLKDTDFNEYSIKAEGKHITIKVNGIVGVDKDFDILPEEGVIAFQLHAGGPMEVNFKDIMFKNLTKK